MIAYPPDWSVDESSLGSGLVYFRHPTDRATWLLITAGSQPERRTADELRDLYYTEQFSDCARKAIDVTRDNEFAGLVFKSLGSTCDAQGAATYAYIGVALNNGVPWRFRLNSPANQYSRNSCQCPMGNVERYFAPMLDTLNIYANP